jgi:hypothetical protein
MPEIKIEPEAHSSLYQKRKLKEELNEPSGQDTKGKCHHGFLKDRIKEEDGEDDGNVEKDRGNRGCEEMAKRVQYPHAESKEAHKKKVGEDDPVEGYR